MGYRPHYPVIIVPGLASTSLEVEDKRKTKRERERLEKNEMELKGKEGGFVITIFQALVTDKGNWKGERVWVDPFKIGKTAVIQKVANIFSTKSTQRKHTSRVDDEPSGGMAGLSDSTESEFTRKWLQHMMLAEDGYSDPPGERRARWAVS